MWPSSLLSNEDREDRAGGGHHLLLHLLLVLVHLLLNCVDLLKFSLLLAESLLLLRQLLLLGFTKSSFLLLHPLNLSLKFLIYELDTLTDLIRVSRPSKRSSANRVRGHTVNVVWSHAIDAILVSTTDHFLPHCVLINEWTVSSTTCIPGLLGLLRLDTIKSLCELDL